MKSWNKLLILAGVAALCGCIENDIPYPEIDPVVTKFVVEGQIGSAVISSDKRTVAIEVDESVDLDALTLLEFETDPSDIVSVTPALESPLDLKSSKYYTLTSVGETYIWQFSASQSIDRYIVAQNQVGLALFNPDAYTALFYVSESQDMTDITITSMKLGPEGSTISPDISEVTDFTLPVYFTVSYRDRTEQWIVTAMHTSSNVVTYATNAWARRAYLSGSYLESSSETPGFDYRQSGTTQWLSVPSSEVSVSGSDFTAEISGLLPNTLYEVRTTLGTEYGETLEFTTEAELQIDNMSFDSWYQATGTGERNTWYAGVQGETLWWDSGNYGANMLSTVNPTSPEESFVVEGKAAKLASTSIAGLAFAAASIFTGDFITTIGTSGAELSFGKPYTVRPSKMTGYYSYTSGTINKTKSPYESLEGEADIAQIYVVLGDWNSPVTINTSTGVFLDVENDANIIAYGSFETSTSTTEYQSISIDLEYRSLTRVPTYAIVVSSASKYGDYFTGSTSSVLYLDEFEFVFE